MLLPLSFPGLATAADLARAIELYKRGDYLEAAEEGTAVGNADGLAVAARALVVNALFFMEGKERLETLHRAQQLAATALESDPDHLFSHLQAAAAFGLEARIKNSGRIGRQAREHLRTILKHEPDHAMALGAMGGWHSEVLTRAGWLFGKLFYGADKDAVFANFERSIALRPDLPSLQTSFARALLLLDDKYEAKAEGLLAGAVSLPPPDRFEALSQIYAGLILDAVRKNQKQRLRGLLKHVPVDEIREASAALP